MSDLIQTSEALKVNLQETKVDEYDFSEKERYIIESVSMYSMLQKKVTAFFRELNHPYPDLTEIIEGFRWIILENIYTFSEMTEKEKILMIFGETCSLIFTLKLDTAQTERLKRTLFNTLELLYKIHKDGKISFELFRYFVDLTDQVLANEKSGLMESSSSLKKYITEICKEPRVHTVVSGMMKRVLIKNILYWKNLQPFTVWLIESGIECGIESQEVEKVIKEQFPDNLFDESMDMIHRASCCEDLFPVPDFTFFTDRIRGTIDLISSPIGKIYYIFYLLELESMSSMREYLLFDLNRTLKLTPFHEGDETAIFISRVFNFFKPIQDRFRSAILECIKTLGVEIIKRGDNDLSDHFFDAVIDFGFVYPEIKGVNSDWQIIVDKNHVKNIRTWLAIIGENPSKSMKLLSALLINLRIGGVFISDTDLFQNDITKLLNSEINSSYHIARQIAVLFPVYFNEIGAEGELRKISTAIDEISFRKDNLLHFLRKQIHAESNNTHIELVRDIFIYWLTGEKKQLEKKIPQEIYVSLDSSGEMYEGVHAVSVHLNEAVQGNYDSLFTAKMSRIEEFAGELDSNDEKDKKKVEYLFKLHLLLKEKYYLNPGDISKKLRKYSYISSDVINELENYLQNGDWKKAVQTAFLIMSVLKDKVLSSEKTEGVENIYYKRHIAIGIPSMYGEYREPKFEALGMIFRLEQLVSSLIEKIISSAKLSYISAETLKEVAWILDLFKEGMEIGGITNENFNSDLETLRYSLVSSSFSVDQFLNIFEFLAEDVGKIVVDYFLGIHDKNLRKILEQHIEKNNASISCDKEKECYIHKKSEEFYRDVISSSFLMQQIDNLINSVLTLLRAIPHNLSKEDIHLIMSFRNDLVSSSLNTDVSEIDNQVFLGAKGYFLKKIKKYGMPVPDGFILTTELFRRRAALMKHPEMKKEIYSIVKTQLCNLEKLTDLEFGNPRKPLLLSVRSGSAISMPGAMNTFLNVGMNDDFAKELSKKENYGWTSWDCYRRLIQTWGMNFGIDRDIFDSVIADFKKVYKVTKKIDFKPLVMKEISKEYMKVLNSRNVQFEQDLAEQLIVSVKSVFNSWDSRRAKVYREKLNIASEWGTAVIIQKMVLGNINYDSGTGVVFTREPFAGERDIRLYGDFVMCSQGEDVVGGLVHPYPVTEKQRISMKDDPEISMEKDFPQIFNALCETAHELVNKRGYGHQEIEFTFETQKKEDFHILQIRPYHQNENIPVSNVPEGAVYIGEGTGIGSGMIIGRAIFSYGDIALCKQQYPEDKIIVVRPDTVSDDIDMIFEAEGLLTSRGGATSHAAVTAVRLGKTGVVNCKALSVNEQEKNFSLNEHTLKVMDKLIIDGKRGFIYCFKNK